MLNLIFVFQLFQNQMRSVEGAELVGEDLEVGNSAGVLGQSESVVDNDESGRGSGAKYSFKNIINFQPKSLS